MVFWLGDPLRELYPECHEHACEIEAHARAQDARIVNSPVALSNCIKTVQERLWKQAGIFTPTHTRYCDREQLEALIERATGPVPRHRR